MNKLKIYVYLLSPWDTNTKKDQSLKSYRGDLNQTFGKVEQFMFIFPSREYGAIDDVDIDLHIDVSFLDVSICNRFGKLICHFFGALILDGYPVH